MLYNKQNMKLISLNTAIFQANNSHLFKFFKDQNADFVCLQEISRGLEDSVDKKYITIDPINKATTSLKYFFYGPSTVFSDFKVNNYHGAPFSFTFGGQLEFGNYTRSRFEILKAQNIFIENHFTYNIDLSRWPEEEYRAVLVTDHIVKGKKLRILNYHGIWSRDKLGSKRTLRANKLIYNLALQAEGEVIICGDFNLFPHTSPMKIFEKNLISLVDKFKIKTTRPASNELSSSKRNVVDYVWVSSGVKVNKFQVPDVEVSDHLPLILDFDLGADRT